MGGFRYLHRGYDHSYNGSRQILIASCHHQIDKQLKTLIPSFRPGDENTLPHY